MKKYVGTVALLAAVLAGCGGSGDVEEATGPGDEMAAAAKYAQCMRDSGIDVADPTVGEDGSVRLGTPASGPDTDTTALDAALKACEEHAPASRFDATDPKVREERLAFAKCMREHGVDVPDPDARGRVPVEDANVDDKALQDAMAECAGSGGAVPAAPPVGGK